MADIQSNIVVNIDTSAALAELKALQRQISAFHSTMAKGGAASAAVSANMQQNLANTINSSGKFHAEMVRVRSTTESFNTALAKNQLSMKEYFRYAGAASKTFGRLFKQEHETINKVARENVKTLQTQYIKMGRDASGSLRAMSVRPLTLDMKNLQTQVAIAAQKQALLNQLLRQGSTNLLNFGKNTQWAGRQLMVGFTVPLMYFGAAAGKVFMQLEEQAIKFKRVYGDLFTTSSEAAAALKDVQLLANEFTKYGIAVADTMKMAADVAATGKVGADLMSQVASATKLAILGNIDQEKSLETIISLTSTFGIASNDLAKNIDFLNAVENQTLLNIDDLTTAIPKAAPVIQQLGGDVQDLAFFMAAMKEGGINASEGANALKSGLASMINPSAKASAFLANLGINLKGIVEANQGDVKSTVINFAQALDTLDPLNRARAIEQLFGKFQFARISTLFQNVVKEGTQAQTVLGLTKATTEELAILSERELAKVSDSPMFKFKKQIEDLKVAIAPIGGEFLKALTPVIKFFGGIFERFNDLSEGAKKFVVIFTTVVAGIGPILLMSFGLLANGVANIIKMFVGIKSIFNGVGKSSLGLGEQTNYLTQQQMENAAVAASLDQVHQRLQQRFTSEKNAVVQLTAAYLQAVQAQKAFSMVPMRPGMPGKPPMRLAEGIVTVPGPKGAGDVVPAMLSPGESVIPAKQSEKYAPLISGMIADNIPGYIKGKQGKTEFAHIGSMTPVPAATLAAQLNQMEGAVTARALRVINAVAAQFGNALMVNVYGKLGMTTGQTSTGKSINGLLGKPGGVAKSEFVADFDKQGMQRWKASLKAAGLKMDDVSAELTQLDRGIREYMVSVHKGATVTDQTVKQAYEYSTKKMAADSRVVAAFNQLANTAGEARVNISQAVAAKFGLSKVPTAGSKPVVRVGEERIRTGGDRLPFYRSAGFDIVKAATRAIAEGAKSALKVASPSKEMRTVGEQSGAGLVLGAKGQIDDATVAGQQIGAAIKSGAVSGPMPTGSQSRNRAALYGTGPVDADAKSIRRQLEAVEKRKLAEAKKQLKLDEKISQSKQKLYGTTGEITQEMRTQRRLQQSAERALVKATAERAKAEQKEAANVIKQSSLTAAMERLKLRAIKSRTDSELMAARKAKMSQVGGKIGGAAMGLSMVTMMGSMAPGAVGEMFQKAMMPLMLLSMAATLAGSSLGLLALGIGVVIGAYVMNRMAVDKAGDAAIAFADRVNGSNQALQVFAEAAGKVTASEIMDRRRKDEVKQYQTVTGKTTFGESFVEGEKGKALVKDVGANIAQRGSAGASTALFRQLAMGVTSGAMSTEQARSIALNVGDALGNQAFGIQVNAKLTELLGPNGENFIKDPLTIRTKMVDATNRDLAASNARAQKTFGYRGRDVANLGKNIGGGALAGAAVGAVAGQMLIPIPGLGAAVGAGAGALIGGVAGYFNGRKDRGKRIAASTGADAAMQKIALEEQQQMLDGLELEYQKKIDIAKAAGDSVKALQLENDFLDDKQKLLDKQKVTTDTIMANFKGADDGIQEAYMNSADKLMTKKYKGTAVEDVVPMAKQAIEDSAGTQEQKYLLKMEVASGNIDPVTLISLMDLASTNKAAFDSTMNIITKFGGKAASEAQQVADLFIGADGKPNTQLQTDFMLKVSEAKTTKEAQKIIDFNAQIARTGGELDVAYLIKYYNENPEAAKIAQDLFDKVKTGNLDYEVMVRTKFMPEEYLGAIDQEYYKGLSENQKQVYMNEIVTVMSIQDETVFKGDPDVQKWLSEPASKGGGEMYQNASFPVQKAMYAAHLAGIKTAAMDATTPYKGPGDGGGDKKGPDASPLDELIKKIRDLRKAQQGLTVGWGSSMKAMNALFTDSKGKVRNLVPGKDSKGKPLDPFNGLENNLRKKGMGQGAIDFLTGLSVEDYKKIGPKFIEIDKKTGAIKVKNAKQLNALLNNIAVGNFQNENEKFIANIKNQNSAVTKLMAAGMSLEDAYAAVEDSQFAAAIATGNFTTAQVKQMAATKNNSTALLQQQEQLKSVRTYFESLTKAVTDQKVFSGLAKDLARMGMDSSMIATVLSDPTLAKGLADQLKSGKKSAEDIAAAVKKIKDTQTEKAITSINSGDMSAAFQPGYDAAQKLFDIQERMLDKQYRAIFAADEARIVSAEALVTAKQKEIDAQEKNVEIAEKGVEAANKLIAVQNERNDKLSHDLKLMDKAAQSINEKYDKQKAALDKISSINSVIANQQKKQMSLADAITQGDISAAAQAAQELREQQASDAIAEQSKAIDSVRELELSRLVNDEGKTRLQIEEEQYVISEKIYSIQQNELKTAQASVDAANAILKAKQDQLIPLQQGVTDAQAALKASQDALEAEKQKLTVLGKTKLEWEDMKLRVDAAQLANDKLMAGQLAAALATADIVDKTWKEINDKLADYFKKDGTSITIKEIHEIYQVIMGATGGSNGGTPPPAPAPVNAGNIDEVNKTVQDAQKKLITDITTAGTSDVNISEVANNMASSLIANTEATAALGGIAGVLSSARYTGQALVWAAQQAAEAKALKDAEEAAARLAATKALMSGGADAAYDRRTGYSRYAMGGMVGSYLASGGFGMKPIGTDIIPAMLTPGEFVVTKYGVENYGVDNLRAINAGSKTSDSNSVYNYSLTVNAKSDASPDDIARTVISQIKQIEGQRIRGNRL
jgi:hypothetical protein